MIIHKYAHKFERNGKEFFSDIYGSVMQVRMCDGKIRKDVYEIGLEIDEGGSYYGWHDFENGSYSMIWPSRVQLEICFPYGMKAEINAGKGEMVRFSVVSEGIVKKGDVE